MDGCGPESMFMSRLQVNVPIKSGVTNENIFGFAHFKFWSVIKSPKDNSTNIGIHVSNSKVRVGNGEIIRKLSAYKDQGDTQHSERFGPPFRQGAKKLKRFFTKTIGTLNL